MDWAFATAMVDEEWAGITAPWLPGVSWLRPVLFASRGTDLREVGAVDDTLPAARAIGLPRDSAVPGSRLAGVVVLARLAARGLSLLCAFPPLSSSCIPSG